jgi:DNA-binding transcriptional MerR regulator
MTIPHRSSFKFAELTNITGIKPYVIRFWETEFPEISPVLSDDGQKTYSRKDIETLLKIKTLLFEHKLSLQEAKAIMQDPEWDLDKMPHAIKKNPTVRYNDPHLSNIATILKSGLDLIKQIKQKNNWY